jgi:hypothetical protein
MEIRGVTTLTEAFMAFVLVIKNYQKKGYIPNPSLKTFCVLIARFCAFMWKTVTLWRTGAGCVVVAKDKNTIVGTMTIELNPPSLCIDKLFPKELEEIRACGSSFAYFGAFAISCENNRSRTSVRMLRSAEKFLVERNINIGICVIHPNHRRFYEHRGFYFVAQKENMPGYKEAPALLMAINVHEFSL